MSGRFIAGAVAFLLVLWLALPLAEADETLLKNGDGTSARIVMTYGPTVTLDGADPVAWEEEDLTARVMVTNTEALGFGSFVLSFDPSRLQVTDVSSLLPPGVTVVENYFDDHQVRFAFSLNEGQDNIDSVAPGGDNQYGIEDIEVAEISFLTREMADGSTGATAAFNISGSRDDTRLSRRGEQTLERLDYALPAIAPLTVLQRAGLEGVVTFRDYLAHTTGFQVAVHNGQDLVAAVETGDDPATAPGFAFFRLLRDGSYTLSASGPGYMTATQPFQVSKAAAQAENNPIDFSLTLTPGDIVESLGVIGSDGRINTEDFAMICSKFRQQVDWSAPDPDPDLLASDLDRDGTVSIDDIAYVVLYWQED